MSKTIVPARSHDDDTVFTFKPKVSSASVRIVENLGTSFMGRQQQHLDKQKKHIEQAAIHYRSSGQLSPVLRSRKKDKKDEASGDSALNKYTEDVHVVHSASSMTNASHDSGAVPERNYSNHSLVRPCDSPSKDGSPHISSSLQRILEGPYANGNCNIALKTYRSSTLLQSHSKRQHLKWECGDEGKENTVPETQQSMDENYLLSHIRSKTMPPQVCLNRPKLKHKMSSLSGERLKYAKELAEKAIRYRKVFTIQGGYTAVRKSLRRRGWVEKFYRLSGPPKKPPRKKRRESDDEEEDNDNDDDDDDGDATDDDDVDAKIEEPKIPPWEEDDGVYGIMSRIVRNVPPTFLWVLRRDVIDYRYLCKEQMVNHYSKAGSFTTKSGLCINMRNVPWFDNANPDTFFPRCYRLSHDEDKDEFIDDFRLTACMSIVKRAADQAQTIRVPSPVLKDITETVVSKDSTSTSQQQQQRQDSCTNAECTKSQPDSVQTNKCIQVSSECGQEAESPRKRNTSARSHVSTPNSPKDQHRGGRSKKTIKVPLKALEMALDCCEQFIRCKNHEDLDEPEGTSPELSDVQWDMLIQWYYQLVHERGSIGGLTSGALVRCQAAIQQLKVMWPQFEMDGTRNVWIVKPGAKSRGRGIMCYDRLDEMLKLVKSQIVKKEGKYVVQKYIEHPLLVYNTKFDIRQWFAVTDWNPLTLWFYKDCYLRFCSQQFTLDKFDESIHLSNNAIQKNYKNGPRSDKLPSQNMWTHYEFVDYLKSVNRGHLWDETIYPGMKKAVTCALLATQDLIESRKSSFELYGADFMLTEDFQPWLIEINCSPSMESSTAVTAKLCSAVLEDTMKVVIDRRYDRNCNIGAFELAYKQPQITVPPYIGLNMSVEGQGLRKIQAVHHSRRVEATSSASDLSESKDSKDDTTPENKPGDMSNTSSSPGKKESNTIGTLVLSKPTKTVIPKMIRSYGHINVDPNKHISECESINENTNMRMNNATDLTQSAQAQKGGETTDSPSGSASSAPQSSSQNQVPHPPVQSSQSASGPPRRTIPSPSTMYAFTGGRKFISRTSVANSYPIAYLDTGSHSDHKQNQIALNSLESATKPSLSPTSVSITGSGAVLPVPKDCTSTSPVLFTGKLEQSSGAPAKGANLESGDNTFCDPRTNEKRDVSNDRTIGVIDVDNQKPLNDLDCGDVKKVRDTCISAQDMENCGSSNDAMNSEQQSADPPASPDLPIGNGEGQNPHQRQHLRPAPSIKRQVPEVVSGGQTNKIPAKISYKLLDKPTRISYTSMDKFSISQFQGCDPQRGVTNHIGPNVKCTGRLFLRNNNMARHLSSAYISSDTVTAGRHLLTCTVPVGINITGPVMPRLVHQFVAYQLDTKEELPVTRSSVYINTSKSNSSLTIQAHPVSKS